MENATHAAATALGAKPAGSATGLVMPAAERQVLGISLATLDAASFQGSIDGFGVVVPLQDIVQPVSELSRAEAAAETSQAALERAKGLFAADAAVSREALQAAELLATSDREQLALARARAIAATGRGAPWLSRNDRAAALAALGAGESELVAASFPGGLEPVFPVSLTVRRIGDRRREWQAATVWTGPSRPDVPGLTVFGYIEHAEGLVPGQRVSASVPTDAVLHGVIVPAAAIVFSGGESWCFAAAEGDRLERVPVDLGRPAGGGYFVAEGLEPGDRVVTRGAGLLLAREAGGSHADP
jgi:hypothetical protein